MSRVCRLLPPRRHAGARSSTSTDRAWCRAEIAATRPALPPPATTTSKRKRVQCIHVPMALQFGPRLKALLDEPLPIIVGTTSRDGSVQMVPVWYEYRDGQLGLKGGPKRAWVEPTQRDPRARRLGLARKTPSRLSP